MSGAAPPGPAPAPNPNVPAITQPLANAEALNRVVLQLRQAVQSLGGQIGSPTDRAVTFNDLSTMGLTPSALTNMTGSITKLQSQTSAIIQWVNYNDARLQVIEQQLHIMPPAPPPAIPT